MFKHLRQREGLRVLKRLYEERIISQRNIRGDDPFNDWGGGGDVTNLSPF